MKSDIYVEKSLCDPGQKPVPYSIFAVISWVLIVRI